MCANGAPHSKFLPREEAKSTTITMKGLVPTTVTDEYEGRKVETFDVPGEYLQIDIPKTIPCCCYWKTNLWILCVRSILNINNTLRTNKGEMPYILV